MSRWMYRRRWSELSHSEQFGVVCLLLAAVTGTLIGIAIGFTVGVLVS